MTLSLFVNILAVLNLFLVAFILFVKSGNFLPNRLLSLILIIPVIYYLRYIFEITGYFHIERFMLYPAQALVAIYAPFIYAYVRIATGDWRWRHRILFPISILLVIFDIVLSVHFVFFMTTKEQILYIQNIENGWRSYIYIISFTSGAVLQFFYLLSAFVRSKEIVSDCKHATYQERRRLFFVYHFIALLLILFIIQLPLYLVFQHNAINGLYVPFKGVLIFCFVFYKMFQEPDIFVPIEEKLPETIAACAVKDKKESGVLNPQIGVPPEVLDAIYSELQILMIEERLFLDPEISLSSLADKLKICTHKLSLSINARSGKNFYHYVNGFRIEEAKRLLAKSDMKTISIEDIAFMSGFNTRATFYSAFKKQVNQTPTEYLTHLSKNKETDKI